MIGNVTTAVNSAALPAVSSVGKAEEQYVKAKSSVWWDIENCQVPKGSDAHAIARNISSSLINMNYCGPVSIIAYGDTTRIPASIQKALSSTGIALNHVPAGVKDASDKKILVDLLLWAVDNPAPANYLLISGDRDFSNAMHQLRMRGYNILLAQPPQASTALAAAAKSVWLWSNLAGGGAPMSSNDKSQLTNCRFASSYEHRVVNQAPAVAPDGMRIPSLRYKYSSPQSLCDNNIGGNEKCTYNKPIQSTIARSSSFPIVKPDKIQDPSFQRESMERKQFKTAPHEFFGVGRSVGSTYKLDPKPPGTPDFLAASGDPQHLPPLPSVPGNPLIQPVSPRGEPPQVICFNYHEPSTRLSQFSSVISANALNISNLNLAESEHPDLYDSQFNVNGSRPKFTECETPVSYGDSHGGHGHNVQQYLHRCFNVQNHSGPVPPSLRASNTVSVNSVGATQVYMQPPSDYVQGLVVVIMALNTLKEERIIPTEANISDCIRYGDYRLQETDVKKALENALTQRMIVKQSIGALQLYVGKNDKLWGCVNPISGDLSDYSSATWDQIEKYLSSRDGRAAVLASRSRYEAALILKRACLEDHTLGVILQILNMVCMKKKWIIHRQPGWQPIIITVTNTLSDLCELPGTS